MRVLLGAGLLAATLVAACGPCAFDPDCELTCDGSGLVVRVTRQPPRIAVAGEPMDTVEVFVNTLTAERCRLPRPRAGDTVALSVEPEVPLFGRTRAALDERLDARFGTLCVEVPDTAYVLRATLTGFDAPAATSVPFAVVIVGDSTCPQNP